MITIVTHTQFRRPELLERCKQSVASALIPGARHIIIECNGDFAQARYDATQLSEFVAFVDDDDTISTDAIQKTYDAIIATGAGAATTNEAMVDVKGNIIGVSEQRKLYNGVSMHPRVVHHLTMLRSRSVDERALHIANKLKVGICWLIKASAVMSPDGAVHVPIIGANWTLHNSLSTQHKKESSNYDSYIKVISKEIRTTWGERSGMIPLYVE